MDLGEDESRPLQQPANHYDEEDRWSEAPQTFFPTTSSYSEALPLPFFTADEQEQQQQLEAATMTTEAEEEVRRSGVAGLANLGNTCFLNAGLQCLLANSRLAGHFLLARRGRRPEQQPNRLPEEEQEDDKENNQTAQEEDKKDTSTTEKESGSKASLAACFEELLLRVWDGSRHEPVLKPLDFKEALAQRHAQFRDYRQHDCQEFLALLLGTLHDQLNQAAADTDNLHLQHQEQQQQLLNNQQRPELSSGGGCCQLSPLASAAAAESPLPSDCCGGVGGGGDGSSLASSASTNSESPSPSSAASSSSCGGGTNGDNSTCSSSNQGASGDGHHQLQHELRQRPLPLHVQPFLVQPPPLHVNNNMNSSNSNPKTTTQEEQVFGILQQHNELLQENEDKCPAASTARLLAMQQLLAKDSKVRNTNLLSASLSSQSTPPNNALSFDSRKFPRAPASLKKQDLVLDNFRNPFACCALLLAAEEEDGGGDEGQEQLKLLQQQQQHSPARKRLKQTNLDNNKQQQQPASVSGAPQQEEQQEEEPRLMLGSPLATGSQQQHQKEEEEDWEHFQQGTSGEEEEQGDLEWRDYLAHNQSVIVDTFQGQFRSTVRCDVCRHQVTRFEPFMYLPVPLPRALELQLVVLHVPCRGACYGSPRPLAPRRYLLQLHRHESVGQLLARLRELLLKAETEADGLTTTASSQHPPPQQRLALAELRDNYLERVLEEASPLRFLQAATTSGDEEEPQLVAFELPAFEREEGEQAAAPESSLSGSSNLLLDEDRSEQLMMMDDEEAAAGFMQMDLDLPEEPWSGGPATQSNHTAEEADREETCVVCLESKSTQELLLAAATTLSQPPTGALVGAGHRLGCCIVICPGCLEQHARHNASAQGLFACPICNESVNQGDYVPHHGSHQRQTSASSTLVSSSAMATMTSSAAASDSRMICVPVLFRVLQNGGAGQDDQQGGPEQTNNGCAWPPFRLVSLPVLLRLPGRLSARQLYAAAEPFVPLPLPFSLHFVDLKGQACSRCDWKGGCTGCEVARVGDLRLRGGSECLAVQFLEDPPPQQQPLSATAWQEDVSMQGRRPRPQRPLSLQDCLAAFSESELLDEDNPWHCPACDKQRRAHKTLSIWRAPDTLVIVLKRFLFHEMHSIKLEDRVQFEVEELDLGPYLARRRRLSSSNTDSTATPATRYALQSYVCHTGGANSGHYTAFARHALSGQWLFFNDGQVKRQEPRTDDERGYILFYQRVQGSSSGFGCNSEAESALLAQAVLPAAADC